MLKILHIVHWSSGGVFKLAQAMTAHGDRWQAKVVAIENNTGSALDQDSCIFLRTPLFTRGLQHLRKIIAEFRPDIIHTHSFTPLLLTALAAPRNIPVVRSIHNDYPYFAARDARSKLKRWLEGTVYRLRHIPLTVVAPSVAAALPWRNLPSIVVENGVDFAQIGQLANASHDVPPLPAQTLLLASVGRLEAQKNLALLLHAFALCCHNNAVPLALWIVGSGSQLHALRTQAAQLGIDRHVTFWGHQDNPYKLLRRAQIYVSSSIYEGFNLALVEAMSFGIAAVATRSGGVTDHLADGQELLLTESTPQAMSAAILQLINDPALRARVAAHGAHTVCARYSIESMMNSYATFYQNTLNANRTTLDAQR